MLRLQITFLLLFFCGGFALADEKKEFQVLGEVPEGWEVVVLSEAPAIEKWVELKNGEKRKILLKPYSLRPKTDEGAQFSVADPLKAAGQKLDEVLANQNLNLSSSEQDLATMLSRLKQLLRTLPAAAEPKKS